MRTTRGAKKADTIDHRNDIPLAGGCSGECEERINMIIECSYCQSKVDAKILASHEEFDPENDPFPYKVSLLLCPTCQNSILGIQEYLETNHGDSWGKPVRLWPSPDKHISWHVPDVIKVSLEEANRCINAGAYMAAVAMCGRALEGICRHFGTKNQYLGGGIKELRDMGVIDSRILEWSEQLHKHRNIAAHAEDAQIEKEDATDLFDFVTAIAEYIFVLSEKFNAFMKRHKKEAEDKTTT